MKKFDFRKIIIFALAVIMIFSLAACNKKKPDVDPKGGGEEVNYIEDALDDLVDGVDDLVKTVLGVEEEIYATATIFVKSGADVDFEIEIGANIGKAVEKQEIALTVKSEDKEIISLYLQNNTIYVQDKLTNGKITYADGTAKITPGSGIGVYFPLDAATFGEDGKTLAEIIGGVPEMLADLIAGDPDAEEPPTPFTSIRDIELAEGFGLDMILGIVAGVDDVFIAKENASGGYDISIDIANIAELLEGIAPLLSAIGGDEEEDTPPLDLTDPEALIDLIDGLLPGLGGPANELVKLLLGGTIGDLLEGKLTTYPEIIISTTNTNGKFSGLSLSYDFPKNDVSLNAGLKNLTLEKKANNTSIIEENLSNYDPGAVKVNLGVKGFGFDDWQKAEVWATPINDTDAGIGVEGLLKFNGKAIAYGKILGDIMGAVFDFGKVFEALGIDYDGSLKFFAGALESADSAPENSEGILNEEDGGGGILGIVGPVVNLLLGDNSLLSIVEDAEISTTELLFVLGEVNTILAAFDIDVDLSEDGLVALLKQGLDFINDLNDGDALETDADYINLINNIFDANIQGTTLKAALLSKNGINITFDFADKGLGVELYVNLGKTEIFAISLGLGFDMPQTVPAELKTTDEAIEVDYDTMAPIGKILLEWLLDAK